MQAITIAAHSRLFLAGRKAAQSVARFGGQPLWDDIARQPANFAAGFRDEWDDLNLTNPDPNELIRIANHRYENGV